MRIAHMAWLGPSLLAQRRTVSGQGGSCRAGQLRVVVLGGSDLEDLGGEVGRRGSGRDGVGKEKGCGLVQGTEEKVTKSLQMQKLEEVSAPSSNVGTDSVGPSRPWGPGEHSELRR